MTTTASEAELSHISLNELNRLMILKSRLIQEAAKSGLETSDSLAALDFLLFRNGRNRQELNETRRAVEEIQTAIPKVLGDFFPHQSFSPARTALNEQIQGLVNQKLNGREHTSTGPIRFNREEEPYGSTGSDATVTGEQHILR